MDYEAHAKGVMERIGLGVRITYAGPQCPQWCNGDHKHGDRYKVTLTSGGADLWFDFWNSLHDKAHQKRPTVYDVLSCVVSDASAPTDPDEVAEEYGPMKPSQAITIAEWAKKLQAFFTPGELAALQEIR